MRQPVRIACLLVLLVFCRLPAIAIAAESAAGLPIEWQTLATPGEARLVQVRAAGEFCTAPEWTYIVCHGMWGTASGDRFERLCAAIKRELPRCNVRLLDWSAAANPGGGIFMAWRVAKNIDPVADEAAARLKGLPLDPARTTLIGESFGNYVNARAAKQLGGVGQILAFNPASELGGYTPPDLKAAASTAWSFHSWSAFDTSRPIAHRELFLETAAGASELAQHMHGIAWLSERVETGDLSWLRAEQHVPECKADRYSAVAGLRGELLAVEMPRQRPQPASVAASSAPMGTEAALAQTAAR
jgi:pimeloyl-ACP methyl ester carboxylesterase